MRLGIYANTAELQKTREWIFRPNGYEYGPEEDIVKFHLRPWTRTTQGIVDRKAKAKNIPIMDADAALKGVGVGDKKAEAYTRELADFLIDNWENVIAAGPVFFVDKKGKLPDEIIDFYEGEPDGDAIDAFVEAHPDLIEFKKGDALPCISRFKILLFEDVQIAVDIVKAAQSFATLQVADEAGNAGRSSDGTPAQESLPSLTSA